MIITIIIISIIIIFILHSIDDRLRSILKELFKITNRDKENKDYE